jgi:signal peptidase II
MVRRILLVLLVAGSCLGCDQITKGIARSTLSERGPLSYLGDAVRLQYEENPGGMLSLGAKLPDWLRSLLLTWAVAALLSGFLVYTLVGRSLGSAQVVALSLLIGGGLGNLFDRLMYDGCVIDFVIIGLGPVRTAVFNVADVLILAGVAGIALTTFRRRPAEAGQTVADGS